MDNKTKKRLSSRALGFIWLLIIFGALLTVLGITSLCNFNTNNAPVCINQRLTVTQNGSYISVAGSIQNLTSENIFINEIYIHLSGYGGSHTTNYANEKITDISLAPNEAYEIRKTYPYSYSKLNKAIISYITVDSTKYTDIKYSSNGTDFEGQIPTSTIETISLPIGIILLILAAVIYFFARKPEKSTSTLLENDCPQNDTIDDSQSKDTSDDDCQNEDTIVNTDDTSEIIDKMIDKYAVPMTNKAKMEKFSEMFNQPFDQVIGERTVSICNHKSRLYSFRPNWQPNSFAYFIEIPFGKSTRYFACEYSLGATFVLTEWVFDKDKKTAHLNYGEIATDVNEIIHLRDQFIKKVRQIIKEETKDQ